MVGDAAAVAFAAVVAAHETQRILPPEPAGQRRVRAGLGGIDPGTLAAAQVVVGFAVGQDVWRDDPDLMRAYSQASWIWAGVVPGQAGVNLPLYLTDSLVGLGIPRLGFPMVLGVIAASWWVIKRALPADRDPAPGPSRGSPAPRFGGDGWAVPGCSPNARNPNNAALNRQGPIWGRRCCHPED